MPGCEHSAPVAIDIAAFGPDRFVHRQRDQRHVVAEFGLVEHRRPAVMPVLL